MREILIVLTFGDSLDTRIGEIISDLNISTFIQGPVKGLYKNINPWINGQRRTLRIIRELSAVLQV